jgi:hypothetical protein
VKFTQKSKRKNNFLALIQSMVILASMVGSLFAHISFAGAAGTATISNQGSSSVAQNSVGQNSFIQKSFARNLFIPSRQVHPAQFSLVQSSPAQQAGGYTQISPADQITLQQNESLQKNVSGGQLEANISASLLNEPASLTDISTLSVERSSTALTLNGVAGQLSGQSLFALNLNFPPPPIFIPFTFNSSAPQQTQAIISGNARPQKENSADNAKEFSLFNIGSAKTQIIAQNNPNIFSASTVEILRC